MTDPGSIEVVPLGSSFGVELRGVEFEAVPASESFFDMVKKLLDRRFLVLIRNQKIAPLTMQAFMAGFGPLLDIRRHAGEAVHVPDAERIKVISNGLASDGRPLGDGYASAQIWHSDSTVFEAPPGHIGFYCRKTPNPVPQTHFIDMTRVYEDLPEAMKERIARMRVIHHFFPMQIEANVAATAPSLSVDDRRRGVLQPLVRRHLGTGRPILFLPTRRDSLIPGMSEAESLDLLSELWALIEASPHRLSHGLEPDDLLIWDNSATVHSRDGWPQDQERTMWHISAEGEVPIPWHPKRNVNIIGLSPEEARKVNAEMVMLDY